MDLWWGSKQKQTKAAKREKMRLCHLNMMNLALGFIVRISQVPTTHSQESGGEPVYVSVRNGYFKSEDYMYKLFTYEVQSHFSNEGKQSENCFCVQTQRVFSVLKSINQTLHSPPHFFSLTCVRYLIIHFVKEWMLQTWRFLKKFDNEIFYNLIFPFQ